MLKYIIDGNNLIGKISELKKLQENDKQGSREKLALILQRYFVKKNARISLHFDGHPKDEIKILKLKIYYSENLTADEMIKNEITDSNNPKNLVIISSDLNLTQFARKCSCKIVSSEEFAQLIISNSDEKEEAKRIQELDDPEEFKKLFGLK